MGLSDAVAAAVDEACGVVRRLVADLSVPQHQRKETHA
jgi:hypothetical protein